MESTIIDVVYLACNRGIVAEQLASVPAKERKDYEFLKHYTSKLAPEKDVAWSDAFEGAAAWLADRERQRLEHDKREADHPKQGISQYNI